MATCDNRYRILLCAAPPALFCLCVLATLKHTAAALAETVYKSVDEHGVVSYSDTPPAGEGPVEMLLIHVDTPELEESALQQLEDLREATDRMVADRRQREKHRTEMRQLQYKSQPQVVQYAAPAGYDAPYPVYYPFPVYCRKGYCGPGPVHPIPGPPAHLPYPPPGSVISAGHDYPASLVRRSYSPEVRALFER